MKNESSKQAQKKALRKTDVSGSLPSLNEIQLEPVYGSTYCEYSVIEQKLAILYQNQEKILQAIKLLGNDR
jgi:hypothetical protein